MAGVTWPYLSSPEEVPAHSKGQSMKIYLLTVLLALAACASTDPLKATYDGCTATRAAVQATDTALLQGKISKADAQKAFVAFGSMQAGCAAAVAALSASAPAK